MAFHLLLLLLLLLLLKKFRGWTLGSILVNAQICVFQTLAEKHLELTGQQSKNADS